MATICHSNQLMANVRTVLQRSPKSTSARPRRVKIVCGRVHVLIHSSSGTSDNSQWMKRHISYKTTHIHSISTVHKTGSGNRPKLCCRSPKYQKGGPPGVIGKWNTRAAVFVNMCWKWDAPEPLTSLLSGALSCVSTHLIKNTVSVLATSLTWDTFQDGADVVLFENQHVKTT